MSDSSETNATENQAPNRPPFMIIHQYLKDLSVEVPHAPGIFQMQPNNPELSVNVDVTLEQLSEQDFEISLHLNASSSQEGKIQHQTEMVYCAIVNVADMKAEMTQAILFIEIPRLIFPFARQILTSSVINTGFPPINLAPVDFVDMYRHRVEAAKAHVEKEKAAKETANA